MPALSFFLCFLEIDLVDHFYVWWMDFLLIGYWSVIYQGAMVVTFLIAAIYIKEEGQVLMLDAWLDWTIVTVLAGATSTFQILYNEPL